MTALDALNGRQRAFVLAYLGECHGNGTQSAIKAGYGKAGAHVTASRLLRDPKVAPALKELSEALDSAISEGAEAPDIEALRTIVASAKRDQERQLETERRGVASAREIREFLTSMMRGDECDEVIDKRGLPIVTRPPAAARIKAAETLSRIKGLFIDKREITMPQGIALSVAGKPLANLTDEELEVQRRELAKSLSEPLRAPTSGEKVPE